MNLTKEKVCKRKFVAIFLLPMILPPPSQDMEIFMK